MTREDLRKCFPDGYWQEFQDQFGHNFFEVHVDRTIEYDEVLGEIIANKRVLEVGSFPGLETAWLLSRGCIVTPVDSPNYIPQYYTEWLYTKDLDEDVFVLDISSKESVSNSLLVKTVGFVWDFALISDVLLHIDGFPTDFVKWATSRCNKIIFINYIGGDALLTPSKGHDLHRGHSLPSHDRVVEWMSENGMPKVQRISLKSNREILIFEK